MLTPDEARAFYDRFGARQDLDHVDLDAWELVDHSVVVLRRP